MTPAVIKLSCNISDNAQMTLNRALVPKKPNVLNRRAALWLLVAGSVALMSDEAFARRGRRGHRRGHHYRYGDDYEHDRARDAVGAGKAVLLSEILLEVKKVVPGDIVEVDFDDKSETPVYNLTILSKSGSYFDVVVDARSGTILKVKKR